LSYGELDARANQLARYLKKSGIGRESLVGIMMERGIEMIVALLGVLKAGGAYVPLDPAYPQERLTFMLEDAQVSVLLTQARLLPMLPWSAARGVCIDSEWETIVSESVAPVEGGVLAANVAYVIYTSGSTGPPKGVMVAHQGLCNMVTAQVETFGLHAESRILQFASLSFDASAGEIFMALTSGAALCLGRQESLLPGPGLIEMLREQRVTIVTLPPSVLAVLPEAELPDLATLTVAGEACAADLVGRWAGGHQFFNLYGPTEATVWATVAECRDGTEKPLIGRPILNTQGYLLNAQLEPAPIGVAGELHLGGVGLARGYLNRPELTAERFIPNPFSQEPGARLYKTGDLARYHPDGQIEFLGRIDHQVKLRGYRIELGEIETALNAHPDIGDAVVEVREDVPGNKRLVAYIVSAPETEPAINEMRDFLQEIVPNYMIPTSFVHLEALPLTTNGKVDRRALPLPDGYHPELEATYVAPRSEIERAIAAIWLETLKIEKVDIHDNFFNLGGHSVLLAQVHTRLQEAFDQKLAMIDLFKYPTIDTLARYLSERQEQQQPALDESHERAESRRELLMKHAQLRQGSGHGMQGAQDE